MKYLLLLILVPQFAMASALVVRDDLNKIFNIVAVFDFPAPGVSEEEASVLTDDIDRYLNHLIPEVQVGAETWTVLFNLDYQIGENKYPLSASCAHNSMSLSKNLNLEAFVAQFVSNLGAPTSTVTVDEIKKLPFSTLHFVNELTCLGAGSPLAI